jgi:hypothetical protein
MITTEALEARIVGLTQERERLMGQINAYAGAIEDCQYWLSLLTDGPNTDSPEERKED